MGHKDNPLSAGSGKRVLGEILRFKCPADFLNGLKDLQHHFA